MPHAYTEVQLVEQPAIGLFAELGWNFQRMHDLLLPRLLSGQVQSQSLPANQQGICYE